MASSVFASLVDSRSFNCQLALTPFHTSKKQIERFLTATFEVNLVIAFFSICIMDDVLTSFCLVLALLPLRSNVLRMASLPLSVFLRLLPFEVAVRPTTGGLSLHAEVSQ